MSIFQDREAAFESRFAREAELEFLAQSSRDRRIAYWAGELMGYSSEQAARYAKQVIHADFVDPDPDSVAKKLMADLGDKADEATIRAKMAEFLDQARQSLMKPAD